MNAPLDPANRYRSINAMIGRPSLIRAMASNSRWVLSIGKRMLLVAPGRTIAIILMTVVADFANFLAFLLPLKIVMMLAGERVPRYFPQSWQAYDMGQLVVVLASLAAFLFVLHALLSSIIERVTRSGAAEVMRRSAKVGLLLDQEQLTRTAYRQFSGGASGLIFAGLSLLVILLIYPALFVFLTAVLVAAFLLALLLGRMLPAFETTLRGNPSDYLKSVRNIGFYAVFAFLLYEYFFAILPNPLITLASLILSRQLLGRGVGGIRSLHQLCLERARLTAVFFHGKQAIARESSARRQFWALFHPSTADTWLGEALRELTGREATVVERHLIKEASRGTAVFDILTEAPGGERHAYEICVFSRGMRDNAMHEAEMMRQLPPDAPLMSPLRWTGTRDDLNISLFEFEGGEFPSKARGVRAIDIAPALWAIEPPAALLKGYLRSRLTIEARVLPSMLDRLLFFVEDETDRRRMAQLRRALPAIRARVAALPHVVVNPFAYRAMRKDRSGASIVTRWMSWSVEPIGAAWPGKTVSVDGMAEAVGDAAAARPSLAGVDPVAASMAALLYELERAYRRDAYAVALRHAVALQSLHESGEMPVEPQRRKGGKSTARRRRARAAATRTASAGA